MGLGLPREPEILFLLFSAAYLQFEDHPNKELKDLAIDQESAAEDMKKMCNLGHKFVEPLVKCFREDTEHPGRYNQAKHRRILHELKIRPRDITTLIYLALHYDRPDRSDSSREPGYLTADYPEGYSPKSKYGVIRDREIRNSLWGPGSGPLVLVVEACYASNPMELPYFMECVDGKIRRGETEHVGKHDWTGKPPHVQITATTPDHRAIWYPRIGAFFTRAFYNFALRTDLSLEELLAKMQEFVDEQILACGSKDEDGNLLSQQLRVGVTTSHRIKVWVN